MDPNAPSLIGKITVVIQARCLVLPQKNAKHVFGGPLGSGRD
jgi:hypothetical protein